MRPALLLAALLLAGCAGPAYVGEPDERQSHEVSLERESYYVAQLGLARPAHVRIEARVVEGGPIDAWLAVDCSGFARPQGIRALDEALGATSLTLEGDVDAGGCVPFDNAVIAPGTTSPAGAVRVNYTISVWNR